MHTNTNDKKMSYSNEFSVCYMLYNLYIRFRYLCAVLFLVHMFENVNDDGYTICTLV